MSRSRLGPYWHHSQFYCNHTDSDGICVSNQNMDTTPHFTFERACLIPCKVTLTQTLPKHLREERKLRQLPAGRLGLRWLLVLLIPPVVQVCVCQVCVTEQAKQFPVKLRTTNLSDSFV